jgi:hypothetical protein
VLDDLLFPDWSTYAVSCANCGNRRTVLVGDWNVVNYLYGKPPCTGVCPNSGTTTTSANATRPLDPGALSDAALAAELESQNPDSPNDFMQSTHYLDE